MRAVLLLLSCSLRPRLLFLRRHPLCVTRPVSDSCPTRLPRIVRDRVTFYYKTIWTNYHSLDGNVASYVSELSRPLADEVFLFLRTKLILGAELFKTCSAGVVYVGHTTSPSPSPTPSSARRIPNPYLNRCPACHRGRPITGIITIAVIGTTESSPPRSRPRPGPHPHPRPRPPPPPSPPQLRAGGELGTGDIPPS